MRSWAHSLASLWRRSLRFRTLLITLVLTAAAVTIALVWMALWIRNDLFNSRLTQALTDANRADAAAQVTLDSAAVQGDSLQLQNLMTAVGSTLVQQASADMIAMFRVGPASQIAPQGFTSATWAEQVVTPELRNSVQQDAGQQWWQSVALPTEDGGTVPAVMIGQQLEVPGAGPYELYLAYDLDSAAETLAFVQGTLWVVGIVLVVIIGAIAWFVLRSVTVPVGEAADTSARLAAGDLGVRLPVRGEDELATLGRSFNAMADSIQSQIKELADLSLVQQRFVSDVSHELRTPMTTIRLAANMINDRREEFDPATARAAELLDTQVARFETLLTDLLEISRYDAGSVQLEREPTSLAHLAEDVIESMRDIASRHGSDIRFVAPGGYSMVEMDPRRVRRIVRNLLGNAIEHSESGPVVVTVDSNQQAVSLGVRDYGLGIRAEDLERVFDRFWRADPSRTRTLGGTGLGLSISLGDARLHGGELAVWSEPDHGAHFVLTLPRGAHLEPPFPISADPGDDLVAGFDSLGRTEPVPIIDDSAARRTGGEPGG